MIRHYAYYINKSIGKDENLKRELQLEAFLEARTQLQLETFVEACLEAQALEVLTKETSVR